jgi:hypothetical protein
MVARIYGQGKGGASGKKVPQVRIEFPTLRWGGEVPVGRRGWYGERFKTAYERF